MLRAWHKHERRHTDHVAYYIIQPEGKMRDVPQIDFTLQA